jgi:glyoxylate reductase
LLTDKVDEQLIEYSPTLKVISNFAVGYDNIDVAASTHRRLPVGNKPGALTDTTADFAFALILAVGRRIMQGVDYVRAERWKPGSRLF